jgi:hypothetical protein
LGIDRGVAKSVVFGSLGQFYTTKIFGNIELKNSTLGIKFDPDGLTPTWLKYDGSGRLSTRNLTDTAYMDFACKGLVAETISAPKTIQTGTGVTNGIDAYIDVTLGTAFADTNYSVVATADDAVVLWVTGKTTVGFRINTSSAATVCNIDWVAMKR